MRRCPPSAVRQIGLTDDMVRISVGIEDIDDLQRRSRAGPRSDLMALHLQPRPGILPHRLQRSRADSFRRLLRPDRHRLCRDGAADRLLPAGRFAADHRRPLRRTRRLRHRDAERRADRRRRLPATPPATGSGGAPARRCTTGPTRCSSGASTCASRTTTTRSTAARPSSSRASCRSCGRSRPWWPAWPKWATGSSPSTTSSAACSG